MNILIQAYVFCPFVLVVPVIKLLYLRKILNWRPVIQYKALINQNEVQIAIANIL